MRFLIGAKIEDSDHTANKIYPTAPSRKAPRKGDQTSFSREQQEKIRLEHHVSITRRQFDCRGLPLHIQNVAAPYLEAANAISRLPASEETLRALRGLLVARERKIGEMDSTTRGSKIHG